MSERVTKKQQACAHAAVRRVEWARSWALFCEYCSLRFSPAPELTDLRRRLSAQMRYRDVDNTAHATRIGNEIRARDEAQREARGLYEQLASRDAYVAQVKTELERVRADLDELSGRRMRETAFLRNLLIRAIELGS